MWDLLDHFGQHFKKWLLHFLDTKLCFRGLCCQDGMLSLFQEVFIVLGFYLAFSRSFSCINFPLFTPSILSSHLASPLILLFYFPLYNTIFCFPSLEDPISPFWSLYLPNLCGVLQVTHI